MKTIIGNESLLDTLLSAIREKRLASCYLIEGADGTGKLTVARYAAAAICCTNPHEDASPCLSCHSCRTIMSGNYIDVLELRPEEDKKNISVDQIRDMLGFMHVTSTEGEWRVFIIDEGHTMNKQAQNALLKSIEEPGENTVFFLLTNDKTKLLPTVRSRAVFLRTSPLTPDQMREALGEMKIRAAQLEDLIILAQGSLGTAQALLSDRESFEAREQVLEYFRAIMNGASFTRLSLIFPPASTSRNDLSVFLPLMKSALRDLINTAADESTRPEFFTDLAFLQDLASILSMKEAVKLFDLCDSLLRSTEQNVNVFSALSGFHLAAQNLTKID